MPILQDQLKRIMGLLPALEPRHDFGQVLRDIREVQDEEAAEKLHQDQEAKAERDWAYKAECVMDAQYPEGDDE